MTTISEKIWDAGFVNLMLDSIGDGVFTLDEAGNITSWNPSMERITGYTAEEAIGHTCKLIGVSSCFGESCPERLEDCRIFKQDKVEPMECELKHKDGYDVPIIKSARLMKKKSGTVVGIVETMTDLTELKASKRAIEEARRKLGELHRFDKIVGKGNAMQKVFASIRAAAESDTTVSIQGESGTGKEIVAGAIHYNSKRRNKPLVIVNCSALSESLLETELFGHVKGAFTGANYDRTGRFEEADGGTIFLDEISEISPLIQIKLLRVIQEREIERVGESRRRKIDIRIITATNADLLQLVEKGMFRRDLYYRLKVFPIYLPALKQRKEDIPLLIDHFIRNYRKRTGKSITSLDKPVLRAFLNYEWPGNVRELEHAIEHAFVLAGSDQIHISDIPAEINCYSAGAMSQAGVASGSEASRLPAGSRRSGMKLNRELLLDILTDSEWNKAEVARRIGLSRASVWKYMKKWDIPMESPAKLP